MMIGNSTAMTLPSEVEQVQHLALLARRRGRGDCVSSRTMSAAAGHAGDRHRPPRRDVPVGRRRELVRLALALGPGRCRSGRRGSRRETYTVVPDEIARS